MSVSHLFPYPKKTVCMFEKMPKPLCFHKENHEYFPKPYLFIRKSATGRPKPVFEQDSKYQHYSCACLYICRPSCRLKLLSFVFHPIGKPVLLKPNTNMTQPNENPYFLHNKCVFVISIQTATGSTNV